MAAQQSTRDAKSSRRAGSFLNPGVAPCAPSFERFGWKVGLVLLCVVLLTLAFAPVKQFYLAWIALVPWLIVVRKARTGRRAFFWSWLCGTLFFLLNLWWVAYVTFPGMLILVIFLGLYWGLAAIVLRTARILGQVTSSAVDSSQLSAGRGTPMAYRPSAFWTVLLAPVIWVATEWMRGVIFTGLPWLFIGYTQTPILPVCQIADITGAYGVSFWVMMVNALIFVLLYGRHSFARVAGAVAMTGAVTVGLLGYGVFRILQSRHTTRPGPVVLVVQPDYPQSNSGGKSATSLEILHFHLSETEKALDHRPANLVVWSETMMPPINPEALAFTAQFPTTDVEQLVFDAVSELAQTRRTPILTGGMWAEWRTRFRNNEQQAFPVQMRNAAYLIDTSGKIAARYDKIHLVPFGEFTPFKTSFPPLYHFFHLFNPYDDPAEYELTAGSPDAMTVFQLPVDSRAATENSPGHVYRFVTPICFEDIEAALVARMFRPASSGPRAGEKRADFIVNLTNDGWFRANEMSQHLQAAIFRCIENRVPTARSVNTGISGFIDSVGNTSGLLATHCSGFSSHALVLDSRITFYTLFGDVFAIACVVLCGLVFFAAWWVYWRERRATASGKG